MRILTAFEHLAEADDAIHSKSGFQGPWIPLTPKTSRPLEEEGVTPRAKLEEKQR